MGITRQRLEKRLDAEEPLVHQAFPGATIDRAGLLVVIPDHDLPTGWSHEETDVAFQIPASYPAGQPDNICARPDLTLRSGSAPGNSQGVQTHGDRQWLQLSWHIDGGWHPTADPARGDNLVTYALGALARFEEAS